MLSTLTANTNATLAKQPESRVLGFSINETKRLSYASSFDAAKQAGMHATSLSLLWDEIEPKPGVYKSEYLKIANTFYPGQGIKLVLTISPLDTNNCRIPRDLRKLALNDPLFIKRYKNMTKWVMEQLPDVELLCISTGNEVDAYLGQDPERTKQYADFLKQVGDYIHSIKPGIPHGTKLTFAACNTHLGKAIKTASDVVMLTYYPLTEQFNVKSQVEINDNLQKMVQFAGEKPLYILELGCPSSTDLRSSEQRQNEFFIQVLDFWEGHKQKIKSIELTWLNDITHQDANDLAKYYGLHDLRFQQYLSTLGLRRENGVSKPALQTITKRSTNF